MRTRVPGRPGRRLAVGLAVVVLAAVVGAGSWFVTARLGTSASAHGNGSAARSPGNLAPPGGNTGSAAPAGLGDGTASPSVSPASPSPSGAVAIAPAASGNSAAAGVAQFLDQYFNAVNTHDYNAYTALLAPDEQAPTSSQFDSGYKSTTDSGETLSAISAGPDGEVVAHVTFTSRQAPAESPTGTNCDTWAVSLYLVPDSGSYLIDNPPAGYHASYKGCS